VIFNREQSLCLSCPTAGCIWRSL